MANPHGTLLGKGARELVRTTRRGSPGTERVDCSSDRRDGWSQSRFRSDSATEYDCTTPARVCVLHQLDGHASSVDGEGRDIGFVAGEYGPVRLGKCNDERVDC